MALHFSFKSQSKTPPFNSEDRYQCGWRILRNAFPEALAVVLLPNQGHRCHYRSIARTFDKVGLNPWNDNLSEFECHLSELSKD